MKKIISVALLTFTSSSFAASIDCIEQGSAVEKNGTLAVKSLNLQVYSREEGEFTFSHTGTIEGTSSKPALDVTRKIESKSEGTQIVLFNGSYELQSSTSYTLEGGINVTVEAINGNVASLKIEEFSDNDDSSYHSAKINESLTKDKIK